MNKKQLRGLIKECFVELLREGLITEKFASKKISMIHKRLRGRDKEVFQKLHNSHGIAWDQVDDSFVSKGADTSKGINFFFINKDKTNSYAKSSWDARLSGPNLLGVTSGKSVLYAGANTLSKEKGSGWRWSKDPVGMGSKEMNNFKRFNEYADEVWNVDTGGAQKAYGTADKTAERSAAKEGATALLKAKEIAQANKARYEKILSDRLAKSGPADQAIKMVESISAEYNKAIQKRLAMLKKGKVADTWSSSYMGVVSQAYDSIIREFQYLMQEEKNMMVGKKKDIEKGGTGEWSEEKYFRDRMVEHARKIQKHYKEFKLANKKVDMAKSFYDVR
jgi:hypothetical protein